MFTVQPTQDQVQQVLLTFLTTILPPGVGVYEAQDNRVPEPIEPDFVMLTPTRRDRVFTNIDSLGDVAFTASIAGNVMTVSQMLIGLIGIGQQVFGVGLGGTLTITGQPSGVSGSVGTYTLNGTANIGSQTFASGVVSIQVSWQYSYQLDVHGPNSGDNASAISAVFRDSYAADSFENTLASLSLPSLSVSPLYADEGKQIPFINDQSQYENRWVIEAELNVNQLITIPQQYFTAAQLVLKQVDAIFPP